MSLKFDVPISVDKLLEQEVTIFDKNVLIIPQVDNVPIKKLVPYHQILVTFSTFTPAINLLTPTYHNQEIKTLSTLSKNKTNFHYIFMLKFEANKIFFK